MFTNFTKKDLRNGDVIKKRNGSVEIVVLPIGTLVVHPVGHNLLTNINDDLTSNVYRDYDIVAVRRPTHPGDCSFNAFADEFGELVYERKPERAVKVTVKRIKRTTCNGRCKHC